MLLLLTTDDDVLPTTLQHNLNAIKKAEKPIIGRNLKKFVPSTCINRPIGYRPDGLSCRYSLSHVLRTYVLHFDRFDHFVAHFPAFFQSVNNGIITGSIEDDRRFRVTSHREIFQLHFIICRLPSRLSSNVPIQSRWLPSSKLI